MKSDHVLGALRIPIVLVIGAAVGFFTWDSTQIPMRGAIFGLVGICVGWAATTEVAIKFFISATIAGGGGYGARLAMQSAFPSAGPNYETIINIVPVFIGILLLVAAYTILDTSSWLGTPCPHCKTRGRTNREIIKKDYNGQKIEREEHKNVTYNLYHVTYRNWCDSCRKEWQTTGQTRSKAEEELRFS